MLIADSGSTKTDWAWIENGTIVHRVTTAGINPVHQSEEEILVDPQTVLQWGADEVFFYGAGCIPEKKGVVEKVLRKVFPDADRIEVESDLLGAARAVCQKDLRVFLERAQTHVFMMERKLWKTFLL